MVLALPAITDMKSLLATGAESAKADTAKVTTHIDTTTPIHRFAFLMTHLPLKSFSRP
jgi:hypothetical protein